MYLNVNRNGYPQYLTRWHGINKLSLSLSLSLSLRNRISVAFKQRLYIPYAYDVIEGRPAALGVKRGNVRHRQALQPEDQPLHACHTAGLARAAKFFFPRQFRTPSTNSFAYSQSELHDMNMNDLRLRNKSTHARGLVIWL